MNIDEKENYGEENKYFQNHRRQYEDPDIDSPPLNHSITENAQPDYSIDPLLNQGDDRSDDDDDEEEKDTYDKE